MALTTDARDEFISNVESALGGTLIDVELEREDYLKCFYAAKRRFKQHANDGYRREFLVLPVTKNEVLFNLPTDVTIDTIIKIIRPNSSTSIASFESADLFSIVAINDMFNAGTRYGDGSGVRFLEYELVMSQAEKYKRYAALDVDFRHDKFKNTLRVLNPPKADENWFIDCSVSLDDDEYSTIDWIIRWSVTEAKMRLGIAYRKFQSVAGPTGDTQLAGQEYIQEAKEEQQELLEEAKDLMSGDIDYYSITFG